MKTQELVKLILKSSDSNPYTGKLSKKENIEAAIELCELCKKFASEGMEAEAMNVPVEQWDDAIDILRGYLTAY
jgi:hypothetical protein